MTETTSTALSDAPAFLTRPDGATIAYHRIAGKSPGVVFHTGFKSDMTGGKALWLEDFCRRHGRAFLRFDYFGHGQSSGAFSDGTIGRWADDAVHVLDELTEGPQVLVGSSMGGWIILLSARRRAERVAGLLGLAAAPDFTEDLTRNSLTAAQKREIESDGITLIPNCYDGDPYPITRALLEDGKHHLVLRRPIAIRAPVRLIHGNRDEDVPWRTSLRIAEMLETDDVEVTLVKGGGHRLSEPADLDRLTRTLAALLRHIETAAGD